MAEEKKLFSPAAIGELLNGWLIHSHKCRDRHDVAARLYAKGQYALGIPSLVVSTIVGTSVFAALSSNEAPALWVGMLSIAAAVLAALQTFMDFGGRSDKHRSAGAAAVKLVVAWTVKFTQPFCRLDLSPFDDLLSYRVDPDSSEPPRRVASCA